MLKILKYLKKHIKVVLLILILLFIQAFCELALPQYTSNIVNIGIQQGGVDESTPTIIRQSELNKLKLFLTEEEQNVVDNSYQVIDSNTMSQENATSYTKKYPLLSQEALCELTQKDKEELETLTSLLQKPIMMVTFFSTDSEELEKIKNEMSSNMAGMIPNTEGEIEVQQDVDIQNVDIFALLARMPQEARMEMVNKSSEEFDAMPESILEQMATTYIKAEYEAIGVDTHKMQMDYLVSSGLKMLGIALLAMLTTVLVCLLAARVAAKVGMDLRTQVFRKVVNFSNKEMDQFSTASLITRSTNDVQQIQIVCVLLLRMIFYAPIIGIGGVIKVLTTNTSMAWIILVAVIAILCLVGVLFLVAMPKFKVMQKKVDHINLVTREILTGLPVIRAFSREKKEEARFDVANKDLTRTTLFTNRAMTFMMPLMMFIMNCISLMIIWFGAKGVDLGNLQVGDMMAFMTYTMQIVMAFLMITMVSIMLPRAVVSATRIDEVLNTDISIQDKVQTRKTDTSKKGVVSFEHVSFRYPNAEQNVLEDITFTARPGETTAFIGSTGSGKSTLVNLIPRFYDVTEGSIQVDGVDVRELSQKELRDKLGYVPQKGVLFSGTIASNLRYGKEDASKEEIVKAAKIAQADAFIKEKEEQYDSDISQGGSNVSGGQKQRLSIARAIAKNPEIYIFDDSFSALDFKTDVALRKALKKEIKESTVLIVAQRISTIMNAEQIIVLDEGRVAGIGTHKELLQNNEVYRQIASSQLSQAEIQSMIGGQANE